MAKLSERHSPAARSAIADGELLTLNKRGWKHALYRFRVSAAPGNRDARKQALPPLTRLAQRRGPHLDRRTRSTRSTSLPPSLYHQCRPSRRNGLRVGYAVDVDFTPKWFSEFRCHVWSQRRGPGDSELSSAKRFAVSSRASREAAHGAYLDITRLNGLTEFQLTRLAAARTPRTRWVPGPLRSSFDQDAFRSRVSTARV